MEVVAAVHLPSGGSETGSQELTKGSRCTSWFPQPLCSPPQFFPPTFKTSGLMFLKAVLTFLTAGALSINALSSPVAREPEREFPRSFPTTYCYIFYHDLTSLLVHPRCRGPASLHHVGPIRARAFPRAPRGKPRLCATMAKLPQS